MNWTRRAQHSQNRLVNRLFFAAPFEVDNRFDNHGQPGRDDYSVLLGGFGAVPSYVGGRLAESLKHRAVRSGSSINAGWKPRVNEIRSSSAASFRNRRQGLGHSFDFVFMQRTDRSGGVAPAAWSNRKSEGGTT